MPQRFPEHKFWRNRTYDNPVENPTDRNLSNVYIDYGTERTICVEENMIKINVFYVDKICSYLDLYEIIKFMSCTLINVFTFYELLRYAQYKKNVKLINILLKKTVNTILSVATVVNLAHDMYINKIHIVVPKYYSSGILACYTHGDSFGSLFKIDKEFLKYILNCITLSSQDYINIIFNDQLDVFIECYNKMNKRFKKLKILRCAIHFESHKISEYLYTLEKPIKKYISIDFLNKYDIYPDNQKAMESIIENRGLPFIKEMYENATDPKYLNRRIALFIAVKKNDYETVSFLLSKGVKPDSISVIIAGYNGSVEMMKLLLDNGAKPNNAFVYYAAYGGRIEMLKTMYKDGYKFDHEIIYYLVQGGHMILNKLKTFEDLIEPLQDHIMDYVCQNKNAELETIEYLYYKGVKINKHIMRHLSNYGSTEVFRFFMSKGMPIDQHIIGNLATRGQYSIIKCLYDNVVPVISLTSQKNGNIPITRFFDQHKRELDYNTVSKGIRYGCFEVKQSFIITNRSDQMMITDQNQNISDKLECTIYNQLPPVDEGTLQTCARHNHIDLLMYLISRKAPIDEDAMYSAIIRGFTDTCILLYEYYPNVNQYHINLAKLWNRHKILEYLKDKPVVVTTSKPHEDFVITEFNYYNTPIQEILYHACSHGELPVIKSYRGSFGVDLKTPTSSPIFNRYNHDHKNMLYVAVLYGQFEIIKYLETRSEYETAKNDSKYTACATRIGRMDMMRYLIENGYKVCEISMANAIEKYRMNFVKYLIVIKAPIPEDVLKIAKKYNADEIYEFLKNKTG